MNLDWLSSFSRMAIKYINDTIDDSACPQIQRMLERFDFNVFVVEKKPHIYFQNELFLKDKRANQRGNPMLFL